MERHEEQRGEHDEWKLDRVLEKLDHLERMMHRMAIDQATFDTDLAALVAAIGDLVVAVDALLASKPEVDLTAEDSSVQAAAASVAAELAKLAPAPAPEPTPEG